MAADSQASASSPRLNPFAFPSDTDFRFVLLIVMVLGASVSIYNWLYFGTPGSEVWSNAVLECCELYPSPEDIRSLTDFQNISDAVSKCMIEANRPIGLWVLGGISLLICLACLIYWVWPSWIIRRGRLIPLSADDSVDMIACLNDMCHKVGLPYPPIFMLDAANPSISGLAFGRIGRYYMSLPGGLVTLFFTDRPAFRAIVLHELAHLRNADVNKTYFTLSIFWAFVIATLVPFAATSFDNDISWIIRTGWRVFVLILLVYFTRNAVLRSREIYADVRASSCEGPDSALSRVVLEVLQRPKEMVRWRLKLQVHPDPVERHHALEDTYNLFRIGFWDVFGVGVAAAIAFLGINKILYLFLSSSDLGYVITGWVVALLVAWVVGLSAWRSTFASLARGEKLQGAGKSGIALGLGITVGRLISFESLQPIPFELDVIDWAAFFVSNIIMGLFFIIVLVFFLKWVMASASIWLEVATTSCSPRFAYLAGLLVASGFLTIIFKVYFNSTYNVNAPTPIETTFETFLVLAYPLACLYLNVLVSSQLALLMFAILWAFPLAAWFYRKRLDSASNSSWAFLDSTSQQLTFPRQPPTRPGLALKIGLTSGLLFCVSLLIIRIILRLGVSEATESTDEYKYILYFIVNLAPAVLMQAGAAAIVAGRVKRLSKIHGLFAAFIAGGVMTIGISGISLLLGGNIDAEFVWLVFSHVINIGALSALVVMCIFPSADAKLYRRNKGLALEQVRDF